MTLSAARSEKYNNYIKQYASVAKDQQQKYGIPASIILAQALLESAAGESELTRNSNNHFGIKCGNDWTGESVRHDDDKRHECFRKYKHAEQSFEDHSLFLKKPRYQKLFTLSQTDYKGWAHGLRQCGYATDQQYANKLIHIIEEYGLNQYDTEDYSVDEEQREIDLIDLKADEIKKTDADADKDKGKKKKSKMKAIDLYQEHKLYKHNGRTYIIAAAGETFEGLAYEYNINEKALRRFNDASDGRELRAGDKVYLYKKRKRAQLSESFYRVKRGETAWSIAQDKGIQLKTIYQLNGIEEGQEVTINQQLQLR